MAKNILKTASFLLGIVCIFLFGIREWIAQTFGEIPLVQILWHIEKAQTLTGFDFNIVWHFLSWMGLCCVLGVLFSYVFYKRRFWRSQKTDNCLCVLVLCSCMYLTYNIYNTFSFSEWIKMRYTEYAEENDFILQNYAVPEPADIVFEKKNNLIIILLESFTANLRASENDTTCYIPKVETFYARYQHHGHMINCKGTTWTIGALTSWFFGLPLKLPYWVDKNEYLTDSFLPHAESVFDILQENGYANYLFMGSSANFAAMNALFKRGGFIIYDKEYFAEQNRITEKNQSEWGVRDFFLYDEVFKKYEELREQKKPFVLFMQTIDTHFPGYCLEEKRKYHDIRDSWLDADAMLSAFLKKMEPFLGIDPVTVILCGDHTPMGKTIAFNRKRPLFNLFAGRDVPQIPESKLAQNINPMDIAPTILQAAGARWNNDQFGLGVSIFSEDKSFSETEGIPALDEKLLYYSKFYDTFF